VDERMPEISTKMPSWDSVQETKATFAHLVHDQMLARRDDDAKPNEQASPDCIGVHLRPVLNGVHERIKILYEAGKHIERAINR
jgi:hypothetical protein